MSNVALFNQQLPNKVPVPDTNTIDKAVIPNVSSIAKVELFNS
jgi:hypothetical protein